MEQNVYDDCWQLLLRFRRAADETQSASFELFCDCWHEMQMQHIYSAQSNHIEVIQTTLAALHVGKRIACGRRTNGEPIQATQSQRIGGIYLLYVIYNQQPTKHFVRIEVSPGTWDALRKYVEQLNQEDPQRRDIQQMCHIFWKLVQASAFRFTALDYCQALDGLAAYDNLESKALAKQDKNKTVSLMKQHHQSSSGNIQEELRELTELETIFKALCQLEEAYNKQMTPHRSSFAATKIFSQLNDVFGDIKELVMGVEQNCSCDSTNQQLDTRKRIRDKAMFGATEAKISTDEEETEEESAAESIEPHERRMSSATVFGRRLPDDVIRDLEG